MAKKEEVLNALKKSSGFSVLSSTETPSQLRLVGRVPNDKDGTSLKNWHAVIAALLQLTDLGWQVDVSKNYFLREGALVYAWRLIFQGDKLSENYDSIVQSIIVATPRRELTEYPLNAPANRNVPANGRGASVTKVL